MIRLLLAYNVERCRHLQCVFAPWWPIARHSTRSSAGARDRHRLQIFASEVLQWSILLGGLRSDRGCNAAISTETSTWTETWTSVTAERGLQRGMIGERRELVQWPQQHDPHV